MESERPRCRTCVFWETIPEDIRMGMCRRSPPHPMHIQKRQAIKTTAPDQVVPTVILGMWPLIEATQWCGEHTEATRGVGGFYES